MLRQYSDDEESSSTPSHARYYVGSGVRQPSVRTSSTSDDYENVYYVGGQQQGRPPTPQERGLPPLPSRSDRFRIYFSSERGQNGQKIRHGKRHDPYIAVARDEDPRIPYSPQTPRKIVDEDHLYENIP